MVIEIVDFPIKNGDFPYSYVSLPEGMYWIVLVSLAFHGNFMGQPGNHISGFSLESLGESLRNRTTGTWNFLGIKNK